MPILNNRSIKSPHKYYKGVRIIKKATISVMTFLLSIPLFMWTPLAAPTNVYNTPYGTYTTDYQLINDNQYGEIQIGPFVIYAVDKNVSTFKYQFNNYYTGTVTINTFTNINPTNDLAAWRPELFTDNCTVLSYTDSSVTFYIKNVKEFSATLVYPTGKAQFNIQAWANPGTTNITAQTDTQSAVNQILSYVQFINEDSFSIAADMRTVRNKLLDSIGYGSSDDTIETDFDTLISAVNSVGTKIDVLHNDMISIQNIEKLTNVPLESMNAYLMFRSLGSLIVYNTDKLPYYNVTSEQHSSIKSYLYSDKTYYLSMRIYNPTNINFWGQIRIMDNNDNIMSYDRVYHDYFSNYSTVTLSFTPNANGYYYVDLYTSIQGKSITPLYFGENTGLSQEMYSLTHIPNTTHNLLQGIIDAVRNMALNVTNLSVNATGITYNTNQTQVDNSVTNYNTNINNVYTVENNISADFDTYNQQFNPDFGHSLDEQIYTNTYMYTIMNKFNDITFFSVPITLTMIGIVLLAILG